jgi:hypothetical protein
LDHDQFMLKKEGSVTLATMLGYEKFAEKLKSLLEEDVDPLKPAAWGGNATQLVEQVLGEWVTGHTIVKGKPATYNYLIARAKKTYPNVSLENFESLTSDIRRRQEGPTTYHKLKMGLIEDNCQNLLDGKRTKRVKKQ